MTAINNERNHAVDLAKLICACLIPVLHISFVTTSLPVVIIQQYISRLGVPVFFAFSGMFLWKSCLKNGKQKALKRYLIRTGRLFLIWLAIYLPIIVYTFRGKSIVLLIQAIVFETPAFLWFISALWVAAIPFCLITNRRVLHISAAVIYIVGTLFGDAYRWLIGGCAVYEKIFLTTRNGIFFALPLFCVGELLINAKKGNIPLLIASIIALFGEISIAVWHNSPDEMYLLLPIATYFICASIINIKNDKKLWACPPRLSTAIYVLQFGIITITAKVFEHFGLYPQNNFGGCLVYILVILLSMVIYYLTTKIKIQSKIF